MLDLAAGLTKTWVVWCVLCLCCVFCVCVWGGGVGDGWDARDTPFPSCVEAYNENPNIDSSMGLCWRGLFMVTRARVACRTALLCLLFG